ncbi:polyketide cyclase [Tumebacillus avium]|uniref:Polyketide cyclase n=1 Tax=Tumebacillus avium TaxID=1903704 RepID=A0A1Y0IPT0_9BACL|nr:SRPBCC domain-containing protein [Tumebacillus avium]ARU62612.1 polyketide cyclase [Tumebacillus avium]
MSELEITRILNAPRELVFKVWTESAHLQNWWGPTGMKLEVAQLELRPEGIFHYSMETPDGNKMWGKFVYQEITAPERIVYINSFADEAGNTVRAPFSPIFPLEVMNIMTFEEHEGNTKFTLRSTPHNATEEEQQFYAAMHANMQQGFAGTFGQLEAYLETL